MRALIAELLSGEIARALGLPVPRSSSPTSTRTSPGPSPIRDLVPDSFERRLNLALDYLPGSVMFDPVVEHPAADPRRGSSGSTPTSLNADRTPRNTNMLMCTGGSG